VVDFGDPSGHLIYTARSATGQGRVPLAQPNAKAAPRDERESPRGTPVACGGSDVRSPAREVAGSPPSPAPLNGHRSTRRRRPRQAARGDGGLGVGPCPEHSVIPIKTSSWLWLTWETRSGGLQSEVSSSAKELHRVWRGTPAGWSTLPGSRLSRRTVRHKCGSSGESGAR
jgi:hypothetical protein